MGYEVKKVIEFGRENTKPVGLLKGAILLKDGTEQVLQLKLRNNGKDILNRVTVKITCICKDGQTRGVQSYTYEKIFVTSGAEFGTDVAIPLKYKSVESVSVEIEKDIEKLKVSSKNISKKEWNLTWFPKIYNVSVVPVSILFLIYHTIIFINWNLLINEKIIYSHWIIGEIKQLLLAEVSTTVMYLYPITQILLNKNQVNYWKLLISNLTQLLTILILICEWCGWIRVGYFRESLLLLAGCLISVLIHTVIIENNRSRIFLLSMGGAVLLIVFRSHPFSEDLWDWLWDWSRSYTDWSTIYMDWSRSYIAILCEYLKLCINVIGTFVIIKKKIKLR